MGLSSNAIPIQIIFIFLFFFFFCGSLSFIFDVNSGAPVVCKHLDDCGRN